MAMSEDDVRKNCNHEPSTGYWKCRKCGARIVGKRQACPVWLSDGPGPCAGTGEVRYVDIYWCPGCDKEPPSHGPPIMERVADNLF